MTDDGGALHELGLCAASRVIHDGDVSSEAFVSTLLQRERAHAHLNAFITVNDTSVLEAARGADRRRRAGYAAPLLGVPVAIKDSYLTRGLRTTIGTSVLGTFTPTRDAVAVAAIRDAGAVVFGKTNLVEMSYGLTGLNAHYGQVGNPYNASHISGGSSSGAGAAVAARIVPAAFGGDTVGSIRVPASLCGVAGFKPTSGRWPSDGVAPISHRLDSIGLMARSVEDCELVDAILVGGAVSRLGESDGLKDVRFAYAPRQHLVGIDEQVERVFRETLRTLEDAGAQLVEVDLGDDFLALADRVTWPIFFHDTIPTVREFLIANSIPVSVEEIFAGLGEQVHQLWARSAVPPGAGAISDQQCLVALNARQELKHRLVSRVFERADALLFPTTRCAAPRIEDQWAFQVGRQQVTDVFLSRHTHSSNAAGVPGVSLPIALTAQGLPVGLELDAAAGRDRDLLALARRVERMIPRVPSPAMQPHDVQTLRWSIA